MGRTKITVKLDFREDKTIKLISWSAMQRFPRDSGDVVFGNAQMKVQSRGLVVDWERDANAEAGTITLAVQSLTMNVEATTIIRMFNGIDKSSKCFKHVADHEYKHVKLFKRSLTRSIRQIKRMLEREGYPDLKKPLTLPAAEAAAHERRWNDRLSTLHHDELSRASDIALAFSNKLHTKTEQKRTERFCLEFEP